MEHEGGAVRVELAVVHPAVLRIDQQENPDDFSPALVFRFHQPLLSPFPGQRAQHQHHGSCGSHGVLTTKKKVPLVLWGTYFVLPAIERRSRF